MKLNLEIFNIVFIYPKCKSQVEEEDIRKQDVKRRAGKIACLLKRKLEG